MEKEDLKNIVLNNESILHKRSKIRNDMFKKSLNITSGKIHSISVVDLEIIFNLYDKYFFNNYFKDKFKGSIRFSLSKRMTRAAGKTIYQKNINKLSDDNETYEIRMGINFFFKYYEVNREKSVSGIKTCDAFHAFQIVFEHELCHLIELHIYKASNCKNSRFRGLAENIFGHSDIYHKLPTNREISSEKYGFNVGDVVYFNYDGQKHTGIIHRINKRATVMVADSSGDYTDNKGKRYSKWYVPLSIIRKIT